MTSFLDLYGAALRELDTNTYDLFTAVQTQITQSAETLLQHFEAKALRPALGLPCHADVTHCEEEAGGGGAPSCSPISVPELTCPEGAARCLLSLVGTADLSASRCVTPSSLTIKQLLVKELTGLREQGSDESLSALPPPPTPSPPPSASASSGTVMSRLSPAARVTLVLAALWMCTKFWASLSESATLEAFLACLVHHESTIAADMASQVAAAEEEENGVDPALVAVRRDEQMDTAHVNQAATMMAAGAGAAAAPFSVPVASRAAAGACTPPSSPRQDASTLRREGNMGTGEGEGCPAPVEEGRHPLDSALLLGDEALITGAISEPLQHPLELAGVPWRDGAYSWADEVARGVEDAELMLLRCSDYAIPV